MGMLLWASHKNKPLSAIDKTAKAIQISLWLVVCDNLNPSGQPISKIPAINRYIQLMNGY
jgi:hypothetical protein